mmetsp:Transcript_24828/g.24324  ORF Transcript_24828/g.24324 Transcript_24828/m.24324 type:complete len:80 (+) Transcript_24828:69-308(+)
MHPFTNGVIFGLPLHPIEPFINDVGHGESVVSQKLLYLFFVASTDRLFVCSGHLLVILRLQVLIAFYQLRMRFEELLEV